MPRALKGPTNYNTAVRHLAAVRQWVSLDTRISLEEREEIGRNVSNLIQRLLEVDDPKLKNR